MATSRHAQVGSAFLTYAAASKYTGLSEATLIRRVKDGTIKSIMLGHRRLIDRAALENVLGIVPEAE
jgi:excisionase family DNA binding protein